MEYSQKEYEMIGNVLEHINEEGLVSQYFITKILGRGACGAVYLARSQSDPTQQFAIKTLLKLNSEQKVFSEVDLHEMVQEGSRDNNIVGLKFVIDSGDRIFLGLDYCSGGDLYDAITCPSSIFSTPNLTPTSTQSFEECFDQKEPEISPDDHIRDTFLGILNAVKHCHSKGVYHRDIKPENILLTSTGKVRLADFGLATKEPWSKQFGCGSSYYMAPEVRNYAKRDLNNSSPYSCAKADIWSLGVLFLNLCSGQNPWEAASPTDPTFYEYMQNPDVLSQIFSLSTQATHIVGSILTINPNNRINIDDLIELVSNTSSFVYDIEPTLVDIPDYLPKFDDSLHSFSLSFSGLLSSENSGPLGSLPKFTSRSSSSISSDASYSTRSSKSFSDILAFKSLHSSHADKNLTQMENKEGFQLVNDPYLFLSMFA